MTELENLLNYKFINRNLLKMALTHSSYANENRKAGIECNERLEFLGDSILGLIVAEYLYLTYPDLPEGRMTRIRAELVCEQSLVLVASQLNLGKYILLGNGEESSGGRSRPSIVADAVEAILAAVYLDGGREEAKKIIDRYILSRLAENSGVANHDYKSALQELIQKKSGQILSYELSGEFGPDHEKIFEIEVSLNGRPVGKGTGKSKKEAEQMAAKFALERLEQ